MAESRSRRFARLFSPGSALASDRNTGRVQLSSDADAGSSSFLELDDTPTSFGTAGQVVKVNSAGTAFEFADDNEGAAGFSAVNTASRTISSNTTISASQSALSVGPVEIADGVTLTIASGGRHVIV